VVLITVVVAAQFLRRDPAQMGHRPYGEDEVKRPEITPDSSIFTLKTAMLTPQFWIAFGMLACFGFGSFSIIVHIVPHAIWLGIPAIAAANILAFRGGIGILGNFFLGSAADRIGNRRTFIIGFILVALAFLWLIPSEKLWMFYVFMAVFAFASGGMGASESPITAWLFGLRSHGLIYGVVHLGFTVGAAVGPVLTGYVFDVTESYRLAFMVCAAIAASGIALSAILKPTSPPRPLR
jgi:predicted MFS family arabinose efflux permease